MSGVNQKQTIGQFCCILFLSLLLSNILFQMVGYLFSLNVYLHDDLDMVTDMP